MNLILRLIFIIVRARYRPRLQPFDISVVHMRVLPNDLDLQLHMNNGRFLSIMDLGRVDLMIRTGFLAQSAAAAMVSGCRQHAHRLPAFSDRFPIL